MVASSSFFFLRSQMAFSECTWCLQRTRYRIQNDLPRVNFEHAALNKRLQVLDTITVM
jgi:hypothetical protein